MISPTTRDERAASQRFRAVAVGIVLAAVGGRLLAAGYMNRVVAADPDRRFVVAGDAEGYWDLAGDLVAGRPYEVYEPPRRVMRMPGFPLLLATSRAVFGDDPAASRYVLATCGGLGVGLVIVVGTRWAMPPVGLVAGGFAAVSPLFVAFSPVLLTETVFAVAMTAAVAVTREAVVANSPKTRVLLAALAGSLHALATLMKPTWVLVPPLIAAGWAGAILLFGGTGPSWRACLPAALLFVTFAAGLAPWAARNAIVTGTPTVTTLWAGPSLYDGLNPDATGASDMTFFDADGLSSEMSEAEVDREYKRRAFAFATGNPGRAGALAVEKLRRFWNPFLNAGGFADGVAGWALGLFEIGLFVATGAGLWLRRRDAAFLLAACGPVLFFAAVHAAFVGSVRYRVPGEYLLTIPAAVGVVAVATRLVGHRLRTGDAPAGGPA